MWTAVMVALTSLIDWSTGGEFEGLLYLLVMFAINFAGGLLMGWIHWHGRIELKRLADRKRRVALMESRKR